MAGDNFGFIPDEDFGFIPDEDFGFIPDDNLVSIPEKQKKSFWQKIKSVAQSLNPLSPEAIQREKDIANFTQEANIAAAKDLGKIALATISGIPGTEKITRPIFSPISKGIEAVQGAIASNPTADALAAPFKTALSVSKWVSDSLAEGGISPVDLITLGAATATKLRLLSKAPEAVRAAEVAKIKAQVDPKVFEAATEALKPEELMAITGTPEKAKAATSFIPPKEWKTNTNIVKATPPNTTVKPFTLQSALSDKDRAAFEAFKAKLPKRTEINTPLNTSESLPAKISETPIKEAAKPPVENNSLLSTIKQKAFDAREYIQNDWLRVKQMTELPGVKITEATNPYQAEILYHGRLSTRIELAREIVSNIDKDILEVSKRLNIPDEQIIKDVDRYLIVRHAPERNAVLGEKAAGISTAEAKAIKESIELSPHGKDVIRIANKYQELNNQTLDVLLEGEVIDKELYNTLRHKYKNHVPLNRVFDDIDDIGQAISSRPFDVKGTGLQKAKGSEREIADIATNIVSNYEQALMRAEKNRLNLTTLKFARDNKQLGLFNEVPSPKIPGTIKDDPTILSMREKGKPVYLKINDQKLALALRGVNRENVSGVMRLVGAYTRLFSSLATRFNPEFILPNKIRDIQEAIIYASSKGELGAKGALGVVKRDPQSIKAVLEGLKGMDTEGARLYRQMRMDGGTTGGMGLSTRKMVSLDIKNIREINRSNPKKAAQMILKAIDNLNTILEDSTRLSVYREALLRGVSRERAAVLAKEATINFNKFGSGGPVINALYMFSNASIQGSAKMLSAMKNPKVAGSVVAAIAIATAAVNEWNDKVDPDWRDKVSKYDRMSSLPVMYPSSDGGVTYFTIPVSWGIKPIKVAVDYGLDAMSGKGKSVAETMRAITSAIIEGYNPVGGTDITSAITPTILDLPLEIAKNKAWSGNKIRPDWDKNAPASIQYFSSLKNTIPGQIAIKTTEVLSKNGIEISPADINYAYESIIGGTGRFGNKVIDTLKSISKGEKPEVRSIPFVSRFVKTRNPEEIGVGSNDFEDIKKLLSEQSRNKFILNQKAEDAYNQLKKLKGMEAARMFYKISIENPEIANKIIEMKKDEEAGLSYTDKLIKKLGVENGERAKYIVRKVSQMKTKEEKNEYLSKLNRKGIMTDKVMWQVIQLLKEKE